MDPNVQKIIDSTDNFFITGAGGVAKTTLAKEIAKILDISACCPTGIAAVQIEGTTIHSLLGLGLFIGSAESLANRMYNSEKLRERWTNINTIIIDEASMLDVGLFIRMNQVLKKVRTRALNEGYKVSCIIGDKGLNTLFGGIRLILVGDMLQLAPIQYYIEEDPITQEKKSYLYLFEHPIWYELNLKYIYLTESKRYGDDKEFVDILNDIRLGILNERVLKMMKDRSVKPKIIMNGDEPPIIPTMLIATNREVDKFNDEQLSKLKGDEQSYAALFKYTSEKPSISKEDMIKNHLLVDPLVLKVGAQVMLLKNMLDLGLSNGSRGVVIGFDERPPYLPIVKFSNGQTIAIKYHTYTHSTKVSATEKLNATLVHIPLKLAWSCTIHKSQGTTVSDAQICLNTCFAPSMIYVALSRCRSMQGLYISGWSEEVYKRCAPNKKVLEFYKQLEEDLKKTQE